MTYPKLLCRIRTAVLPLVLLLTAISAGAEPVPTDNEKIKLITKLTSEILSRSHYRQRKLDRSQSETIFNEYFETLDGGHYFFTTGDLDDFRPQAPGLADALLAGNADFAFQVYDRYRQRFSEYHKFVLARLGKPFDFKGKDTFRFDRRKEPRARDQIELHALWEKRLKNELLTDRLLKRSLAETAAADKKSAKGANAARDDRAAIRELWDAHTPEERIRKRLRDLQNSIDQQNRFDILGAYLTAVAQTYGPHSAYYSPKLDEDFEINMRTSLTGIGATLTSDDGYIKIVEVVPGGPADKSGKLHAEDRIIAVAQEGAKPVDVIDMSVSNAVKLIRGPAGSRVTLTVLPGRKGRQGSPEVVNMVREKIELKDSQAQGEIREIPDGKGGKKRIGVIDLPSFYMDFEAAYRGDPEYRSCSRDVRKILLEFRRDKVDAVVIDLRGNGGGSLPEAVALTGLFITTGPVVQVRHANRDSRPQSDDDPSVAYSGPLVVLTNKLSASASEIFAAAIKDYRRGLVVGDSRTFGKGTVLDVVPLERMLRYIGVPRFDAGSAKYETAMFYRIAGGSVQQLGISPDIKLPSITEEMEIGEMFSDNHLPWDEIRPLRYERYDKTLEKKLPRLRDASEKRIAADPEYRKIFRTVEFLRRNRDRKEISLNEETRYREYLREKEMNEKLEEADGSAEDAPAENRSAAERRKQRRNDAVLNEAIHIAADYAAE